MKPTPDASTRRRLLISILAIGITIGAATQARAQGFISPFIGSDFGGDAACPNLSNCQDKKLNIGFSFGKMGNVFGIEEELAYAPSFFGDAPGLTSSVLTLMTNIMLVPNLGPVRPYVLAGVGLMKSHVEMTTGSVFTTDNNNLGWDVGGGLMLFLGGHFGVRGDLRFFHGFQDLSFQGFTLGDSKLDYGRASGGVVLRF